MKSVKLNYVGMGDEFNPKQNLIYDILINNGYQVEISDEPDYMICGFCDVDDPYRYCSANQVRIMYSGENYVPDFNLIDYAISPYPVSFLDRSFYLPACVWPRSHWLEMRTKVRGGTYRIS